MKKIRIMVPTFNEEDNIYNMVLAIEEVMKSTSYDYEILIIDNKSCDNTREIITEITKLNSKVKAIFNTRNFGQFNSPFYAMIVSNFCDATISICADFEQPVNFILDFLKKWEEGYSVVIGVKENLVNNKFIKFMKNVYYKLSNKYSDISMLKNYDGFGLYDKSVIKMLASLNDPIPFIRGLVVEVSSDIYIMKYEQAKRIAGKSSNNFLSLYDASMISFTSYTKFIPRLFLLIGFISLISSFMFSAIMFFYNFKYFMFSIGFIIGSLILFSLGIVSEYIMMINKRLLNRPLVVEEKRINF